MKKTIQKNRNLDLIIILIAVTIIAVITAFVLALKPYEIDEFERITEVNINTYNKMNSNTDKYLVLLYDSTNKDVKFEQIAECVTQYAEFARGNKKTPKIYVIDYHKYPDMISSSNFSISSLNVKEQIPCLATITTSGTVSNKKTTIRDICNLLEDYKTGKEEFIPSTSDEHNHVH